MNSRFTHQVGKIYPLKITNLLIKWVKFTRIITQAKDLSTKAEGLSPQAKGLSTMAESLSPQAGGLSPQVEIPDKLLLHINRIGKRISNNDEMGKIIIEEADIVKDFELSENVRLYAKLPAWFKIDTPLGSYNPDWTVLWENAGQEKVYFVCESKGSVDELQLRGIELGKITCGRKHFEQTAKGVSFELIREAKELSRIY